MSRRLRISTVRMICLGAFYLFVLLVYAVSAQAETQKFSALGANAEQIEAMATRLQLTAEQRQAIQPVLKDHAQATRAILDKHGIDPQSGTRPSLSVLFALRRDMKQSRKVLEERLAAILNPDQMKQFRQISDERRKQIRDRLGQTN